MRMRVRVHSGRNLSIRFPSEDPQSRGRGQTRDAEEESGERREPVIEKKAVRFSEIG